MPEPKITIKNDDEIKMVYSNYASINTSPLECSLTFCYIDPSKISPPNIDANMVAKIVLPLPVAKSLIEALTVNFETMEKEIEKIK